MEGLRKKKKWTEREMSKMKEYIVQNEDMLVRIFYKNIYEGKHIYRKRDGFFQGIGKVLGRKSSECKSKFQKHEKVIYTIYLRIPIHHYEIFLFYRKIANFKNSTKPLLNPSLCYIRTQIISKMNTKFWKFQELKSIPCSSQKHQDIPIFIPINNKKSKNLNKITLPSLSKRENFLDQTDSIINQRHKTDCMDSPERSIFSILEEKRNYTFFQQNCGQESDGRSIVKTGKVLSTGLHIDEGRNKENKVSIPKGDTQKCFNFECFKIDSNSLKNLDCCDLLQSENSPSN